MFVFCPTEAIDSKEKLLKAVCKFKESGLAAMLGKPANMPLALDFHKSNLLFSMINNTDCTGIRIYPVLTEEGLLSVAIFGYTLKVDDGGNTTYDEFETPEGVSFVFDCCPQPPPPPNTTKFWKEVQGHCSPIQ